jgi:hypothetical protein
MRDFFHILWTFEKILKFIYSEKATKFCEVFILLCSYVVPVKSMVKILQYFVAFSEYMNFSNIIGSWLKNPEKHMDAV